MPISKDEFDKLPEAPVAAHGSGRKVDWISVTAEIITEDKAVTVDDVHPIAIKFSSTGTIGRFRVKRWLDEQVEKNKAVRKYDGFRMFYVFVTE